MEILIFYHDEAANLNEETHLDYLVSDAVKVCADELVRVLNHINENLYFCFNLIQIRRHWAEEQLDVLLLVLVCEAEAHHILIVR